MEKHPQNQMFLYLLQIETGLLLKILFKTLLKKQITEQANAIYII